MGRLPRLCARSGGLQRMFRGLGGQVQHTAGGRRHSSAILRTNRSVRRCATISSSIGRIIGLVVSALQIWGCYRKNFGVACQISWLCVNKLWLPWPKCLWTSANIARTSTWISNGWMAARSSALHAHGRPTTVRDSSVAGR